MINIEKNDRLLFIGDSITDAGRRNYFKADLGQGYVNMIAGQLFRQYFHYQLKVFNKGIGGDTVTDLLHRWQKDCLNLKPNIVTIQIGINDLWQRQQAGLSMTPISLQQFTNHYQYLINQLKEQEALRHTIMIEPFLLPFPATNLQLRDDLDLMNTAIDKLAKDNQIPLVKTDAILNRLGKGLSYQFVTGEDGVHPTSFGHAHLAERWFVTTKL